MAGWLTTMARTFHATDPTVSGRRIRVRVLSRSVGELTDALGGNYYLPHVVVADSSLQLPALQRAGRDRLRLAKATPLARSRMAMVMTPAAARLLDASVEVGWGELVTPATRGRLKLLQLHPRAHPAGMLALLDQLSIGRAADTPLDAEDVKAVGKLAALQHAVVRYSGSPAAMVESLCRWPSEEPVAAAVPEPVARSVKASNLVVARMSGSRYALDHPAALVMAEWVSPDEQSAARAFVEFCLQGEAQARLARADLQPVRPVATQAAGDANHPTQPPGEHVLHAALTQWQRSRKPARVAVVIDTSESMQRNRRLQRATEGAADLLNRLSGGEGLRLWTFAGGAALKWTDGNAPTAEKLARRLSAVQPAGGTALLDAIAAARGEFTDTGRRTIDVVVVFTDGEEFNSALSPQELTRQVGEGDVLLVPVVVNDLLSAPAAQLFRDLTDACHSRWYHVRGRSMQSVVRDVAAMVQPADLPQE